MYNRIEDFENDPNWKRSLGEKLDSIHFRNGHEHAVCENYLAFVNLQLISKLII